MVRSHQPVYFDSAHYAGASPPDFQNFDQMADSGHPILGSRQAKPGKSLEIDRNRHTFQGKGAFEENFSRIRILKIAIFP